MRNLFVNILLISTISLLTACKENEPLVYDKENINEFENLPKVELIYKKLFDVKFSSSWIALGKQNSNFVFYSCCGDLVKYNDLTKSWMSKNYSSDMRFSREQSGNFFVNGNSLLLIASPRSTLVFPNGYNYIFVNSENLDLHFSKAELPFKSVEYYTSSIKYKNTFVTICITTNKMYLIDSENLSSQLIDYNPLNSSGDKTVLGIFRDNLFYYVLGSKIIKKKNLITLANQEIVIPDYITMKMRFRPRVGIVDNLMCFWIDDLRNVACFDMSKEQWYDGGENYFWNSPLNNWLTLPTDSSLYYYQLESPLFEIIKKQ